ncbi:hypothetical protein ACFVH6_42505 [Spirillospora sp. NPDC127200]
MGAGMVGRVIWERYEVLVAQARELVERQSRRQFALGDAALLIEPIQSRGGQSHGPVEKAVGVEEALKAFADGIGVPLGTVRTYRWVSSRWSKERRRAGLPPSAPHPGLDPR